MILDPDINTVETEVEALTFSPEATIEEVKALYLQQHELKDLVRDLPSRKYLAKDVSFLTFHIMRKPYRGIVTSSLDPIPGAVGVGSALTNLFFYGYEDNSRLFSSQHIDEPSASEIAAIVDDQLQRAAHRERGINFIDLGTRYEFNAEGYYSKLVLLPKDLALSTGRDISEYPGVKMKSGTVAVKSVLTQPEALAIYTSMRNSSNRITNYFKQGKDSNDLRVASSRKSF
jgi:hypothetical protein